MCVFLSFALGVNFVLLSVFFFPLYISILWFIVLFFFKDFCFANRLFCKLFYRFVLNTFLFNTQICMINHNKIVGNWKWEILDCELHWSQMMRLIGFKSLNWILNNFDARDILALRQLYVLFLLKSKIIRFKKKKPTERIPILRCCDFLCVTIMCDLFFFFN